MPYQACLVKADEERGQSLSPSTDGRGPWTLGLPPSTLQDAWIFNLCSLSPKHFPSQSSGELADSNWAG